MTYQQIWMWIEIQVNGETTVPVPLYQGTGIDKIATILRARSAGGAEADPNCGRPTDEEGREQAKGNHGQANPLQGIVEYSTEKRVATGFGRRMGCEMVVVMIKAKYLRQGSGSEYGLCCYASAPIEFGQLERVPGIKVNLIGAGGKFLNAD